MKYSWQIVTFLLAITVTILSISLIINNEPINDQNREAAEINESEIVINSIMTRSSVRKYSDKEVEKEIVEKVLRAGMSAPTAGNRQPWEFYVIRDTNIIRQFPKVTKFADPMAKEASVAIVVCGVPSEAFPIEPSYWVQDVSAATENILLAIHALGLGAVWCGVYPGEQRVATLRELLDVPIKLTPFNIIFLGYPEGEPSVKDKWKAEKIHYIVNP